MEIVNQRINVKAVKAYQTVEMEMTVSNATEEEIITVKEYLLNEARIAVEALARDIEENTQTQTVKPKSQQPVQNTGNPYFQNTPKPVQKPKSEVLNIGGYNYRKCVNKQGGVFYALVNDADAQYAKKYLQVDDVQAYFNGGQYGC